MTGSPDYLASPEALRAALGELEAADLVLLAAQALRLGSLDYAARLCEAYGGPESAALTLTHAASLFGLGEQARGVELVEQVLAKEPAHLAALFYRAQMAQALREPERAAQLLLAVLERFPDFPGAQGALASLRLPGPPYREVLKRLHELTQPRSYLEIGVETGATLAFARTAERAIGIDPDASKLRPELVPPRARVFHETSDDFFAKRTRTEVLGPHRLDMAFIDGMHWFEYALRDFINVEAWSEPNGTIVLHDCLPIFPLTASRERRTKFWVGDVWKVVVILRELRPELSVKVVATAPSGLCVVRGLDPKSGVLRERLAEVTARYRDAPYPVGALETPPGFTLVAPSEAGLRDALQ